MVAEHAHLEPLLTAVDTALAAREPDLVETVQELAASVDEHCKHEEERALPLIQSRMEPADRRGFAGQVRRRQGNEGAALYVPWILDGTPLAEQRKFLAAMPAPVKLINRLFWARRYQRRNMWNL